MTFTEGMPGSAPDDEKLVSLLHDIARQFSPSKDYSLLASLKDVSPLPHAKQEIEARFNHEIDPSIGSNMKLFYDQKSRQLVLNQLSIPIIHDDGPGASVNLRRGSQCSSETQYHSYVQLPNQSIIPYEPSQRPGWQDALSKNIIEGHDMVVRPNSEDHYRIWLGAHILTKARSWELIEKMRLHRNELGDASEHISVVRAQSVPDERYTDNDNSPQNEMALSILKEIIHEVNGNQIIEEQDQLSLRMTPDTQWFIRYRQNILNEKKESLATIQELSYFTKLLTDALKNRSY